MLSVDFDACRYSIVTDNMEKFSELLSKDENVKKELEAVLSGLSKDAKNSFTDAAIKVADQHGITLTEEDFKPEERELSEDELQAVAGGSICYGSWFDGHCEEWFNGECKQLSW